MPHPLETTRRELLSLRDKVCTCYIRTEVLKFHQSNCPELKIERALKAIGRADVFEKGR